MQVLRKHYRKLSKQLSEKEIFHFPMPKVLTHKHKRQSVEEIMKKALNGALDRQVTKKHAVLKLLFSHAVTVLMFPEDILGEARELLKFPSVPQLELDKKGKHLKINIYGIEQGTIQYTAVKDLGKYLHILNEIEKQS